LATANVDGMHATASDAPRASEAQHSERRTNSVKYNSMSYVIGAEKAFGAVLNVICLANRGYKTKGRCSGSRKDSLAWPLGTPLAARSWESAGLSVLNCVF